MHLHHDGTSIKAEYDASYTGATTEGVQKHKIIQAFAAGLPFPSHPTRYEIPIPSLLPI
jgi:hypothetical protein